VFDTLFDSNKRAIREILESPSPPKLSLSGTTLANDTESELALFNKVKNIYFACMDEASIQKNGKQPLIDLVGKLDHRLQGSVDREVLSDMITDIHSMGTDLLIGVGIDSDLHDPTKQVIAIGQAGLGLPAVEYYQDEKYTKVYSKAIQSTFIEVFGNQATTYEDLVATFGRGAPKAPPAPQNPKGIEWSKLADDITELEKKLAGISWNNEQLSDPIATYNPTSFDKLQSYSKVVPWKSLFEKLMKRNNVQLPLPEIIVVITPSYFEKLDSILQATSPDVINYYVLWHAILEHMDLVDKKTQTALEEFRSVVFGMTPGARPPRDDTCLRVVDNAVGFAAGRWYIATQFSGSARNDAKQMIEGVVNAYSSRFSEITWLDAKTKAAAIEKAKSLDRKVGFPDKTLNVAELVEQYRAVEANVGNHFGNVMSGNRNFVLNAWKKLGKPTDYTEWGMTPQTVNAYYNPPHNEIVCLFDYLFYLLPDYPAFTYNAIGLAIL
jgi:endothelin-converting enzyme